MPSGGNDVTYTLNKSTSFLSNAKRIVTNDLIQMLAAVFIFSTTLSWLLQISSMSIFKKILGRKNSVLSDKSIGTTTQSDLNDGAPETSPRQDLLTPRRRSNVRKDNLKDSIGYQPYFHKSVSSGSSSESVDSTGLEEAEAGETAISPSTTEDDILDEFVDNQSRRLVAKLQNLK